MVIYTFSYWLIDGVTYSQSSVDVVMSVDRVVQAVYVEGEVVQIATSLVLSLGLAECLGGDPVPVNGKLSRVDGLLTGMQNILIVDGVTESVLVTLKTDENGYYSGVFIAPSQQGNHNIVSYFAGSGILSSSYSLDHWEFNGVVVAGGQTVSLIVDADIIIDAVYTENPPNFSTLSLVLKSAKLKNTGAYNLKIGKRNK